MNAKTKQQIGEFLVYKSSNGGDLCNLYTHLANVWDPQEDACDKDFLEMEVDVCVNLYPDRYEDIAKRLADTFWEELNKFKRKWD